MSYLHFLSTKFASNANGCHMYCYALNLLVQVGLLVHLFGLLLCMMADDFTVVCTKFISLETMTCASPIQLLHTTAILCFLQHKLSPHNLMSFIFRPCYNFWPLFGGTLPHETLCWLQGPARWFQRLQDMVAMGLHHYHWYFLASWGTFVMQCIPHWHRLYPILIIFSLATRFCHCWICICLYPSLTCFWWTTKETDSWSRFMQFEVLQHIQYCYGLYMMSLIYYLLIRISQDSNVALDTYHLDYGTRVVY